MRKATTITIDEELLRHAKKYALNNGQTLSGLISLSLRRNLYGENR